MHEPTFCEANKINAVKGTDDVLGQRDKCDNAKGLACCLDHVRPRTCSVGEKTDARSKSKLNEP